MNYQQDLENFLVQKNNKNKIIVIYGPTASGKTRMSIDIAKMLETEIISTDSRQIFRWMDIGTGKITEEEKQGIPHHMIDIIDPSERFSVGEFQTQAEAHMQRLWTQKKIPILCWGTGLYIDSLIYDFQIPKIPADWNLRNQLEKEAEEFWKEYIYKKLQEIDSIYAKQVHPNNLPYVIRGIEVMTLTGKSKAEAKQEKTLKYDTFFLHPYAWERETLYNNINLRVQQMFQEWLLEEVKKLAQQGYTEKDFSMQSIWYQEVFPHLRGEKTLEETIAEVQQWSRNYAKRQIAWFKNYKNT